MFSPQQFANVPPPASISNLPGFQASSQPQPQVPSPSPQPQQQHQQTESGSFANIFGQTSVPAQLPPAAAFNPAALSYPNASVSQSAVQLNYSQATAVSAASALQTYTTYPQQLQGTAVTTPISLPGMPPITVSATIPPQQYAGFASPSTEQQSG